MTAALLPHGSYLASRYADAPRRFETRRVYREDGRVEAFDGQEWWLVCTLTPEQVRQAKSAVRESGLTTAADLGGDGVFDAASLTYAWDLGDTAGQVTNAAYPARHHPAMASLEARLDEIEGAGDS